MIVITVLLVTPLLVAMIWLFDLAAEDKYAWAYISGVYVIFQLIVVLIVPVWILPCFNTYEPLEDGDLKTAINNFAQEREFECEGIYKMDGSKRTSHSNAFFVGFGKTRRIVLFDTLIENQSIEQITAILAHEIGHVKLNHILWGLVRDICLKTFEFYLQQQLLFHAGMHSALQISIPSIYTSMVIIQIFSTPLDLFVGVVQHYISRLNEFSADRYSAEFYKKPELLIEALKQLSKNSLVNLTPHPITVFATYSHPPLADRIKALRSFKQKIE